MKQKSNIIRDNSANFIFYTFEIQLILTEKVTVFHC